MGRQRRFFLVERYVPSVTAPAVASSVQRLNAATRGDARHLMTLLVPREETCLSVFQAEDTEAVNAANSAAGFDVDRVVEVQVFPGSGTRRKGDSR
jgi:hypothetical protein